MSAHSNVMRSRDTARGRPDMTAAGDGALLAGSDVTVLVVDHVVVACSSAPDTSGAVVGVAVGVAGSSGDWPTHGGRKSKAWCMRISGRSVRRAASPQRFAKNAA